MSATPAASTAESWNLQEDKVGAFWNRRIHGRRLDPSHREPEHHERRHPVPCEGDQCGSADGSRHRHGRGKQPVFGKTVLGDGNAAKVIGGSDRRVEREKTGSGHGAEDAALHRGNDRVKGHSGCLRNLVRSDDVGGEDVLGHRVG
jgi:hypothetical protein